jgi:hypothetical protein
MAMRNHVFLLACFFVFIGITSFAQSPSEPEFKCPCAWNALDSAGQKHFISFARERIIPVSEEKVADPAFLKAIGVLDFFADSLAADSAIYSC